MNLLSIQKIKVINKYIHEWFFTMCERLKTQMLPKSAELQVHSLALVISVAHNKWLMFFLLLPFSHLGQMFFHTFLTTEEHTLAFVFGSCLAALSLGRLGPQTVFFSGKYSQPVAQVVIWAWIQLMVTEQDRIKGFWMRSWAKLAGRGWAEKTHGSWGRQQSICDGHPQTKQGQSPGGRSREQSFSGWHWIELNLGIQV